VIQNISKVFGESRLSLIYHDLMDIDALSANEDIHLEDAILATLLVSDLDVRLWTFLEAMRGRDNVHILCQNNRILSARDLFRKFSDMAGLALSYLSSPAAIS
jgi:hypothetical protein